MTSSAFGGKLVSVSACCSPAVLEMVMGKLSPRWVSDMGSFSHLLGSVVIWVAQQQRAALLSIIKQGLALANPTDLNVHFS